MDTLPFSFEGLTNEQKVAISNLWKDNQTKVFTGINISMCIKDFRAANALAQTNPEKAKANEAALLPCAATYPNTINFFSWSLGFFRMHQ